MPAVPAQPSNKRAMIFLGIGLGLVLLLVVVPKVLSGGGSDTAADSPAADSGVARPVAPATTAPAAKPGDEPVETFEVFSTKNPFTPLVNISATGAAPAPSTGAATATNVGVASPAPTGGSASPAPAPTGSAGAAEPRSGQRIALMEVFDNGGSKAANIRVNDTVFEKLAPGTEFGGSYKVVSLEDQCGSFLFGDDRFRLCQGEEVLK